jgi:archaellum component FlaC
MVKKELFKEALKSIRVLENVIANLEKEVKELTRQNNAFQEQSNKTGIEVDKLREEIRSR